MIKPYVEEFSKETGKAHANGLHNGLPKLWSKVFGPKPEVTYTILGTAGRPEMFSHAFSVRTTRNDGGHVTLLFPPATSCGDFLVAVDRFIELMEKHYALNGTDPLTKAMGLVSYLSHRNYQALIYMNPETGKLELIDYIGSSKERKLMTHPILE